MTVNVNPFLAVLNSLGWTTSPSHEDHRWIWLLLQYGAAQYTANSESSTYSDPFKEVLSRMSAFPGPAYVTLERIFHGVRGG